MDMMMDYDALMAFATFAKHCNFTHAARELYITQPALHAKVKRLTESVEVALYERRGRQLVLTSAGEVLVEHAHHVASLTQETLMRLKHPDVHGPLGISAGASTMMHLLTPAMREAKNGPYPLKFKLSKYAVDDVLKGRAHLSVTVHTPEEQKRLTITPLCDVRAMVVVPNDHPLATRAQVSAYDLQDAELIVAPSGGYRDAITEYFARHDVSWQVAMEAGEWDLMIKLVSFGAGLTITQDFIGLPEDVVGIPLQGFNTGQYSIGHLPNPAHPGVLWLTNLIVETVKAHRNTSI